MLGKQGWHILTNPHTFIARMFKASYFPQCDFFQAKLGYKPSYVWRSLCNSRNILKTGSRWSIGDGGKEEKRWDVPFLEAIFDQKIASHIVNTPLFQSVKEDRLVWTKENNGEYSVRNAYRLCMQELMDTSEFRVSGQWELISKLQAPPKVKNFMWRIARNVLPTRVRLRDKRIHCLLNCVLCNTNDETNMHLFFNCRSSRNVWNLSTISTTINNVVAQGLDCSDTIFQILQVQPKAESAIFACIMWSIWKQHNNKVWNDVVDAQSFVLERATSMLFEWEAVRKVSQKPTNQCKPSNGLKWEKPRAGRMKCNIYASFPIHDNKVGIDICIRDENGAFVLVKTKWFQPSCEVHIGEVLGLLSALQWVHELHLGPIDFELD